MNQARANGGLGSAGRRSAVARVCRAVEALEPRRMLSVSSVERVSVDSGGGQGDAFSGASSVSADGRFVAYSSTASNFSTGDAAGRVSIFLRDRTTGATTRVSRAADGSQPDSPCFDPVISGDGRYVAYSSRSRNLVTPDTGGRSNIFVYDVVAGTTRVVSASGAGVAGDFNSYSPSISADGRYVAFVSDATNLVPGDANDAADVYVFDLVAGTPRRVSVSGVGVQGNASSYNPVISGDGTVVAFLSDATNLVGGDTNGTADVFAVTLATGGVTRASVSTAGAQANGASGKIAVSGDGKVIAFESDATNLVAGDTNGQKDIFVRDLSASGGPTTKRVSVSISGGSAGGASTSPAVSADGRYVAFASAGADLIAGDGNGKGDVFLYDRQFSTTRRVSGGPNDLAPDDASDLPAMSSDGRYVTFFSNATNIVPADTNGVGDVFAKDLQATAKVQVEGVSPGGGLVAVTANAGGFGTADGTDFGLTDIAGETATRTFTVRNTGIEVLKLTGTPAVTFLGSQAEFVVTGQPGVSELSPGETTTFTVRFDPAAVGSRAAVVSVPTNDPQAPVFSFRLGGRGVDQANVTRVAVFQNDAAVAFGGAAVGFGTVAFNATAPEVTFTVINTSRATITLDPVALEANSGFVVSGLLAELTLSPSASTTFTLRMITSTAGTMSAGVRLTNTAFNVQSAVFSVGGVVQAAVQPGGGGGTTPGGGTNPGTTTPGGGDPGTTPGDGGGPVVNPGSDPGPGTPPVTPPVVVVPAPKVVLVTGGAVTENGGAVVFEPVVQGTSQPIRQYTIRNDGDATLTLGTPVLPAGFSVAGAVAGRLEPGQSTSFVLVLSTEEPGGFGGPLLIPTNDPDAANVTLDLAGTVAAAPKVGVTAEAVALTKLPAGASIVGGTKAKGAATVTLKNHTGSAVAGEYRVTLYASLGKRPNEATDMVLGTVKAKVKLKNQQSVGVKANLVFGSVAADGAYGVYAVVTGPGADPIYRVGKSAATVAIRRPVAVLVPTAAVSAGPRPAALGKAVVTSLTLTNTGNVPASGSATYDLYLSTDGTISGATAVKVGAGKLKLSAAAGKAQKVAAKVTLPKGLPAGFGAGTYQVVMVVTQLAGAKSNVDATAFTAVRVGEVRLS